MLVITPLSSMYDFKGFHGKSSSGHHSGKDHGRTYRFIAPTSDTFFSHSTGYFGTWPHVTARKKEISFLLTTWLYIIIF